MKYRRLHLSFRTEQLPGIQKTRAIKYMIRAFLLMCVIIHEKYLTKHLTCFTDLYS